MSPLFSIYTDASFSKQGLLAVSGFLLFRNKEEQEAGPSPESFLRTQAFPETTNLRAEIKGVLWALGEVGEQIRKRREVGEEKVEIHLYTDCQGVAQLLARRKKLEASGFKSRRKKERLSQADLYEAFFALYDQWLPKIFWVKGHASRKYQDVIQRNFNWIDKRVRRELREKMNLR